MFEEGIGFDGSSIRGFQQIQESDMLLFPDPTTAFMDPFSAETDALPHLQRQGPGDRRGLLPATRGTSRRRRRTYLKSTGIGDTAYFGPEPEFFIFDDVRYGQTYNEGYYHVDAGEGFWNAGRTENPDGAGNSRNLGNKIRGTSRGTSPCRRHGQPPGSADRDAARARSKWVSTVEVHHHEVGTAGQAEIDMRFDSLVSMGDKLLKYKYAIKNVARKPRQDGYA